MRKPHELKQLLSEGREDEVVNDLLAITAQVDSKLYNDVIGCSSRYQHLTRQRRNDINAPEYEKVERNKIVGSLTEVIDILENKKTAFLKEAKDKSTDAIEAGDYIVAKSILEKVKVLDENGDIQSRINELRNKITAKTQPFVRNEEKFPIIATIIFALLIFSLIPSIIYFIKFPDLYKQGIQGPYLERFNFGYIVNLILHLTVLTFMVRYKIKPKINEENFSEITKHSEYIRNKFNNTDEIQWYTERANETIKQFSTWWQRLGWAFLSLYAVYYVSWIIKNCNEGFDKMIKPFEDWADVIANTSEGFFLYVLYAIVTKETLKPSVTKNQLFEDKLDYWNFLAILIAIAALFTAGSLGLSLFGANQIYGVYALVSRALSAAFVAVGICLLIGRIDSKFIEPQNFELSLLYLYAATQMLFALFDVRLFEYAADASSQKIEYFVGELKTYVLYAILALKVYFIYFIIKIDKHNELFIYFLLGSKLNHEMNQSKLN